MSPIITVHSSHFGAGKSELTANLAYFLAMQGHRVAVVDLTNPSTLPQRFGLDPTLINRQWQAVLWQPSLWKTELADAWVPINDGAIAILTLGAADSNPASGFTLARELQQPKRQEQMNQNLAALLTQLQSDFLLIETTPGFNEEAFLAFAISDLLTLMLRLESDDFQDTAVITDLAYQLQVPQTCLVANPVPPNLPFEDLVVQLTEAYNLPILGLLPPTPTTLNTPAQPLLYKAQPDHPYSRGIEAIAHQIMTLLH